MRVENRDMPSVYARLKVLFAMRCGQWLTLGLTGHTLISVIVKCNIFESHKRFRDYGHYTQVSRISH